MNLVIVCSHYSRGNGGASSLIDLADAARRAGARVDTFVTQQRGLHYIQAFIKSTIKSKGFGIYHAPLALRRVIGDDTNSRRRFLAGIGRLSEAGLCRLRDKASLTCLRKADVIVVAGLVTAADFSYLRSVNLKARLVFNHPGSPRAFIDYWLNPSTVESEEVDCETRLAKYSRLLKPFDAVLFQSPMQATELEQLLPECHGKTIVIRPGVDEVALAKVPDLPRRFEHREETRLVTVGSIQSRKNQLDAIRIMGILSSRHPRMTMHIVGGVVNVSYYEELLTEVQALGISDRVVFHGHSGDYASLIASSDILVHTAVAEGVPRVLREAMFMGVPIVATDISGVSDLLADDESAYLFQVGEITEASNAIERLVASPEERRRLVDAASEAFEKRHGRRMIEHSVASELLGKPSSSKSCWQ